LANPVEDQLALQRLVTEYAYAIDEREWHRQAIHHAPHIVDEYGELLAATRNR